MGIEATSYGALLSPVLSKLPPELRLIVSRKIPDSNLDMDALLATFEELTARVRANPQSTRRGQESASHSLYFVFWFLRIESRSPMHLLSTVTFILKLLLCYWCCCTQADSQQQWTVLQLSPT